MPKYATLAIDSAAELARLCFSWDMKKKAGDMESIRQVFNYPGATERLNILVRRMKDFRKKGMNIVFTAHEDIQRIYAKGGMVGKKGEPAPEPLAVKGQPNLPGNTCPDEFCLAADNVFHVRRVNGTPNWIARPEAMGPGAGDWTVKDRFNAPSLQSGLLPASYIELEKLAKGLPGWRPPYIWILYGAFGIGKTRSLLTFPRPIKIFDIDRGTSSIIPEIEASKDSITVEEFNSEDKSDYERFISSLEAAGV